MCAQNIGNRLMDLLFTIKVLHVFLWICEVKTFGS